MRNELIQIREWATAKIQGGSEPPWAWYQYMKLVEAIDAITRGMDATISMESSPQSVSRQDVHLRLVDSTYPQDTAQPHSAGLPVQMPM